MGQLVHFYSSGSGLDLLFGPEVTGSERAKTTGAIGVRVTSFLDFYSSMDNFVKIGTKIDRMVIETHGSPGAIYFDQDMVTVTSIQSLAGRRYETIFEDDARIFLNGCNIAESECSTGTCGPDGNGRKFLFEVAKVFLKRGGGRIGASTSKGLAMPISNKVYHLWGNTVYVYINKGGTDIRIAAGHELKTPAGQWKVTTQGDTYFYWFYSGGSVKWDDGSIFGGDSGSGAWSTEGSKIKISWQSGGREEWDMPLTTLEQTGRWTTSGGVTSDITAEKIIDSNRIID